MKRKSIIFLSLVLLSFIVLGHIVEARGRSSGGSVSVRGHTRKDGTYVAPHMRSAPDGNFYNNWSTKGNINPYTGAEGTRVTPPNSYKNSDGVMSPSETINYNTESGGNLNETSSSNYLDKSKRGDIERARYWKDKGYDFDPNRMSSYSMDNKVKDIERARYWKDKGYDFDPNRMTSYSMDQEARRNINPK
ncbi:MAG: hypothetical protein NT140_05590 [Deltaproteobacteria bacterium]|nr:hypothetical protein [Deltaproteobacteria bacterium]